jgi:hypothetical protein
MSSDDKPIKRRLGSTPTYKPRLDSKGQPIEPNPLNMPTRKVTRRPAKPHVPEAPPSGTPIYDQVAIDLGWDPVAGQRSPGLLQQLRDEYAASTKEKADKRAAQKQAKIDRAEAKAAKRETDNA